MLEKSKLRKLRLSGPNEDDCQPIQSKAILVSRKSVGAELESLVQSCLAYAEYTFKHGKQTDRLVAAAVCHAINYRNSASFLIDSNGHVVKSKHLAAFLGWNRAVTRSRLTYAVSQGRLLEDNLGRIFLPTRLRKSAKYSKEYPPSDSSRLLPARLRFAVFQRDKFTCQYCGRKTPEIVLEVDHKLSRHNGGSDEESNLVTSCRTCNTGKSKKNAA